MGLMNSLGMRLENPGNKTQRSFVLYSNTMQLTMVCVSPLLSVGMTSF